MAGHVNTQSLQQPISSLLALIIDKFKHFLIGFDDIMMTEIGEHLILFSKQ